MTIRERVRPADRPARIVAAARDMAERDGWSAVTVRRLAGAIGYSQPVLYQHFPGGRSQIVAAVAREAFGLVAHAIRPPRGTTGAPAVHAIAEGYLRFADEHPALYEAMFELPSDERFATAATPAQVREPFEIIAAAFAGSPDPGTEAELFWATLHGLVTLERGGRLPARSREARVAAAVRRYA